MNTPHLPQPPPAEVALVMAALATVVLLLALVGCNGVTPNGPLSIGSNQSFALYKSEQYYETGALKSKMEIENYVSIAPNPELTQAGKELGMTVVATKGLVDITEATVLNPNATPPLAKDPNTIKVNPNKIPKNPNIIPTDPNIIHTPTP